MDQTKDGSANTKDTGERFVSVVEEMSQAITAPEMTDEQVWLSMWTCVANCFNCKDAKTAAAWADKGLDQFRDRFPRSVT